MKKNLIFLSLFLLFTLACKKAKAPISDFLYSGNNAAPSNVVFTNTSTNASSYVWDFGDNSFSKESDPSHIYTAPGVFTVKLKAIGEGGENSTTKTVNIQQAVGPPLPIAAFSFSNGGCTASCAVQFTNSSTNTKTQTWDFGDGSSSTEANPSHQFNSSGNFTVTLKVTGDGGTNSTTKTVNIQQPIGPTADFSFSGGNCVAACSVSFTNNSTSSTVYLWDFGDGATTSVPSPSHIYQQSGTFTVTLKAGNASGQTNISTKTVTIAGKPKGLTVNKVVVTKFPMTDSNGSSWDFTSSPDIFLTLDLGNAATNSPLYTTNTYSDAASGNTYTFATNWNMNSPDGFYSIIMYDYDTVDPNDFMGGISFIPNSYSSGKPSTIVLDKFGFTFTLYVTWQ